MVELAGTATVAFAQPLGGIAIAVAPLIAAGAWISAHFHGWTEMEGRIAIRRGWLKPTTTLLPFASVQSADLATDFILRPFGLATLQIGRASGRVRVCPYVWIPVVPLSLTKHI